jgi:hypothetical protein
MHSLIHPELARSRSDLYVARHGRAGRGHPPPPRGAPRLRGAAAALLARTAVRLDAERAWRTLA